MFDRKLSQKLNSLIKEKFEIIYDYKFNGIVLLYGGTIRNNIMNLPIKDLDFVILTQDKCQIIDFIQKFKLSYSHNAGGGYKILYNNFTIDISSINDLIDAGIYDADMLFYDIQKHIFISCGAIRAFKNRKITEINNKNALYSNKARLKKIIKFIKYISNSNKRVKVKQNKLLWEYKLLTEKIKRNIKQITKGNMIKCLRFLNNCKKELYLNILLGLIITLISIILPFLSAKLITNISNENYKILFIIICLIAILKSISILFSYFLAKIFLKIRKKMILNIRREMANCVLSLAVNEFNDNHSGTFIDKIKNDPNSISQTFNQIKNILINGLGNLGTLIIILCIDYRIGIFILISMIIIFKIKMIGIRKRRYYRQTYYYEQEKCTSVLGEMVNGVHDIKGLSLKDNYMQKAIDSFETISVQEFKGDCENQFYNQLANFIQCICLGLTLILGIILINYNLLDTGSLIIIFMYHTSLFSFLDKLGKLTNLLFELELSCNRIFSLLDGNNYSNEVFGNIYKNKCQGKIEFHHVNFKYKYNENYVLSNCTFKINENEIIALVGKSGTGKTTILNLISRLYNVDSGCIKIDEININDYNEQFIRENISIISQNPYLFDMSIKENLKLVKEDITDKEIIDVCKKVCLDRFIESLPNKYDTVIGEGGIKLSGGQKQRLGIARALIKNTKIILLDEITSSLDNENGTNVKKIINNIKQNHTVIIVTHELSMIKDSNRILVLDDGKIVGDGTHSELIQNNKIYKKLYKIK